MLVLRGGRVLDPAQGLDETADVVIEGGRITRIDRDAGAALTGPTIRSLELSGKWVCPCLRPPQYDD